MNTLRFYEILPEYLDYLRKEEPKVPNNVKDGHAKPYCGIVLSINNINYYAPISSFSKKQFTNFPILDVNSTIKKDKIISTIRFSYMVPAPDYVLTEKDFKSEDKKYTNLLKKELEFCKKNKHEIETIANKIYNLKPTHYFYNQCCNFKLLEKLYLTYNQSPTKLIEKEIALT